METIDRLTSEPGILFLNRNWTIHTLNARCIELTNLTIHSQLPDTWIQAARESLISTERVVTTVLLLNNNQPFHLRLTADNGGSHVRVEVTPLTGILEVVVARFVEMLQLVLQGGVSTERSPFDTGSTDLTRVSSSPIQSPRILIVDAEANVRNGAMDFLSPNYSFVNTTSSACEAFEHLVNADKACRPFDLMIVDLMIPDFGVLLRDTEKAFPALRILYFFDEHSCSVSGVDEARIVRKPIQCEQLLMVVTAALSR